MSIWHPVEARNFMLFAPLAIFLLAILCEYTDFDIWWVSHFYDAGNQVWPFMRHWFFQGILHTGARRFIRLIGLIWLLGFILVSVRPQWRRYRKGLLYVLCGSALGPVIVGADKQLTHIYSPWDLQMFGSTQPYIRLFDYVPSQAPIGHAFRSIVPTYRANNSEAVSGVYFASSRRVATVLFERPTSNVQHSTSNMENATLVYFDKE